MHINPSPTSAIYNCRTGEYEFRESPIEDWRDYIPQDKMAQLLYYLYQVQGDTPTEAACKVLEIATRAVRGNSA